MSMNCYCPINGNIYRNKMDDYLRKRYEARKLKKTEQNRYNNLSLSKKIKKTRQLRSL